MRDDFFKSFLTRAFHFLLGSSVSSGLNFLALMILANQLELSQFGLFSLVLAIVLLIEGVSSSQSWQAVVRYGPEMERPNKYELNRLFNYSFKVDVINILIAVSILILITNFASILEIDNPIYLLVYGLILPFRFLGVFQGILRFQNRLIFINLQLIISSSVKLVVACVCFFYEDISVLYILIGYAVADILGAIFLIASACAVADRSIFSFVSSLWEGDNYDQRFTKFTLINHFNVSSVLFVRNIDEVIVAKVLTLEALAVYKIIKIINGVVSKLAEPLYITVYPEMSKLIVSSKIDELKEFLIRLIKVSGILVCLYMFVLAFFGKEIIELALNSAIGDVEYYSFLLYSTGVGLTVLFFFAHPLAISAGKEGMVLKLNLILGLGYISLVLFIGGIWGMVGVSLSFLVYSFLSTVFRIYFGVGLFYGR